MARNWYSLHLDKPTRGDARVPDQAYNATSGESSRARIAEGEPMTDANSSAEEVLSQARGNAVAFILTTIAYLEERGMAVEDFVDFFGRQFAPGWDELRARPMLEVAQAVTRNAVSVGCSLGS